MARKSIWVENDAKLKILKQKIKKESELKVIKDAIEPFKAEKVKLEKQKEGYRERVRELEGEIVKAKKEEDDTGFFIEELKTDYKPKYDAYVLAYPTSAKRKWINDVKALDKPEEGKIYSNNIGKIKIGGKEIEATLDEIDCIAGAISWQFGRVKVADFDKNINLLTSNSTRQTKLKKLFKKLRDEQFIFIVPFRNDTERNGEDVYMFGHENTNLLNEKGEIAKINGIEQWRDDSVVVEEFPYKKFFKFCNQITLDDSGGKNLKFIRALNETAKSSIIQNATVSLAPHDGLYKDSIGLDGTTYEEIKDHFYACKQFSQGDIYSRKIEKGLEDWMSLYDEVYSDPITRDKSIIWSAEIVDAIDEEVTFNDSNPWIERDNKLTSADFISKYFFKSGITNEEFYTTTDYENLRRDQVTKIQTLKSLQDLKSKEITKQNEKIVEIDEKIDQEQAKIIVEDDKVKPLIDAAIEVKKAEIKKTDFSKSDFDWTNFDNIVNAASVKQLLIDIRFLKNEGNSAGSLDDTELEAVWKVIIDNQTTHSLDWNKTIKYVFDNKGKNLAERIAKVKSEAAAGGPSLEVFREVFAALGEKDVVTEIDKELNIPPVGGDKLKDWTDKLKVIDPTLETAFTEARKAMWVLTKKFKTPAQLETLLNNVKGKTDFFTTIKDKGGAIDNSITTLKDLIEKKAPKDVIIAVERYKYEKLDKTATDKKEGNAQEQKDRQIKKALGKTGADTLNDDDKNNTLYEFAEGTKTETTNKLDADLNEITTTPPNNENGNGEKSWWKRWGYVGIWGPALVITLGAVAIFWKQISEWWSGPTEEGGETEGEKEEENE